MWDARVRGHDREERGRKTRRTPRERESREDIYRRDLTSPRLLDPVPYWTRCSRDRTAN
jgi:hypothetical protein